MDGIHLIFDFDSTFVKVESLDLLAQKALEQNPERDQIAAEIKNITTLGMEGKLPFSESLSRRLALFSAHKAQVDEIEEKVKNSVTASFDRNRDFFAENRENIHIISGGFKDMILKTSRDFMIPDENVHANTFIFNDAGHIVGADPESYFSQNGGKAKTLRTLSLPPIVAVVGDGWTDYEMKVAGGADYFLAFTENIRRNNVAQKADRTVGNMEELLDFIHTR